MKLIQNNGVHTIQFRIGEQAAGQYTLRQEM